MGLAAGLLLFTGCGGGAAAYFLLRLAWPLRKKTEPFLKAAAWFLLLLGLACAGGTLWMFAAAWACLSYRF